MANQSLIYIPKANFHATLRLLCFSYAGGSAATYLPWQNLLNPNVELAVVQLPGRGIRMSQEPFQSMEEIVRKLFIALEPLRRKPLIFFGHSMGARVAYELLIMLRRFQYPLPVHFIASGSSAPSVERTKKHLHILPDDQFIEGIRELNGSPEEILADLELMQLVLPALRADFKITETYCNKSRVIMPTTISVLAGEQDEISVNSIEPWFNIFEKNTGIHWVSGNHFFIDQNKKDTLEIINKLVSNYIPNPLEIEC